MHRQIRAWPTLRVNPKVLREELLRIGIDAGVAERPAQLIICRCLAAGWTIPQTQWLTCWRN